MSYALTDTPGSSNYIDRAFVTYSNQAKHELLGVNEQTLNTYGAVSEQTVLEMAPGAAKAAKADIAVAVSGIAGPGGATLDKPVGLVWFCIHFQQVKNVRARYFLGIEQMLERKLLFIL